MIYTLTLNPAIDYVLYCENYAPGKINRSDSEKIYFGGKGINVSAVLKQLDQPTVAMGFCAGHTGVMLCEMLKSADIDSDFVMLDKGITRINVKIKSDVETDINANAPVIDGVSLEKLYSKLDLMGDNDTLVLAGSVPKSLSPTIYCDIMDHFKHKNIRFVVDAENKTLVSSLKSHPFLIKPNIFEISDIFETTLKTTDEIICAAKELRNRGAQNVLVSLGEDGAVLISADGGVYTIDAPCGEVINTTGAGDSMVAGFLAGFEMSGDYKCALRLAVCSGSATAFSEGLASKKKIDELFNDCSIEVKVIQ